jgi:DNA replication and repair protein RecF
MFVREIVLNSFRNYRHLDLSFQDSRIFVTGENGVGKTNLLEALYYLSLGRSFRKAQDNSLIENGVKQASLYLTFDDEKDGKRHTLSAVLTPAGRTFAYDDEKLPSLTKILGRYLAVCYTPEMAFFYKEPPMEKRRLLDEVGCQLSPAYLYAATRYMKLLKERNNGLAKHYDQDVLDVYRNQLMNVAYRIVQDRKALIRKLSALVQDYYVQLFGEEHRFGLVYRTNCPMDDDEESFLANAKKKFEENQSFENLRCQTLIGPHRDDLLAQLDGKDVALYGSQGENRIASLSLRLAILDLYEKSLGKRPVLILDDVLSDLDEKRAGNLLHAVGQKGQVFLSGTKVPQEVRDYTVLVTDGKEVRPR